MTCTENSKNRLPKLKNVIKDQLIHAEPQHQTSVSINKFVGQQVFVKATYFRTTRPLKKLSEKNLGPFKIMAQVGPASFTLRLPEHMKAVHPVFHVSQLELSTPNMIPNRIQPPPPPVEVDNDIEYEIAEILDSKLDKRCKCKLL